MTKKFIDCLNCQYSVITDDTLLGNRPYEKFLNFMSQGPQCSYSKNEKGYRLYQFKTIIIKDNQKYIKNCPLDKSKKK